MSVCSSACLPRPVTVKKDAREKAAIITISFCTQSGNSSCRIPLIFPMFLFWSRGEILVLAGRIFDRLKTKNREVWADGEDIPATADWWAEVQAGIEGANTFVFIISPDSVMSDVCRREIDHAIQNNKRF